MSWRRPSLVQRLCFALLASGCQLAIPDYTRRACDDTHGCVLNYQCVAGLCSPDGATPPPATAEAIRVTKAQNQFTYELSLDNGVTWQTTGALSAAISVSQAGRYVGNSDSNPATHAAFGPLLYPGSGSLTLSLPASSDADCWEDVFTCVTRLQPVPGGDGTYQISLSNLSVHQSYQYAGLMLYQDDANFLRFEIHAETHVFASAFSVLSGTGATQIVGPNIAPGPSNALRVVKSGTTYSFQYSLDGGASWQTAGQFTALLSIQRAGPYIGDSSPLETDATFGALQYPGADSLVLTAPGGSIHDCTAAGFGCVADLQPVQGLDGKYQVSLSGLALSAATQYAGLMFYQDTANFVRFELWTGGAGVFAQALSVVGGAQSPPVQGPQLTLGDPATLPAPASSLSAVAISDSEVQLSWLDNSSNETRFTVMRRATQTSDPFVDVQELPANVTSYVDPGLNRTWQYDYQIIAHNDVGDAAPSNTVTVQVLAP